MKPGWARGLAAGALLAGMLALVFSWVSRDTQSGTASADVGRSNPVVRQASAPQASTTPSGGGSAGAKAGKQPAARTPFNLTRLARFGFLPAKQATQRYLNFLREETAHPSPTGRGAFGSISHDYILAQIVGAGATNQLDWAALRRARQESASREFRDAINITLGMLGDRSVVPFLIGYIGNPQNPPELRQRAIVAFGRHPDRRAIPALAGALNDPYSTSSGDVGPPRKSYHIRSTARAALTRIKDAGMPLPAEVQRQLDRVVTDEPIVQWDHFPPSRNPLVPSR
ncbi:MAG TPA: HEAT repeat domain-containing protein [Armatimonadota bacterium]|nr:HEAT repeat domain-containing protein [Armatimonadota bacterium]